MIPDHVKTNFNTLASALRENRLAILEVKRKDNGEPAYVIVAVNKDGDEVELVPFAEMLDDAYERFDPPEERQ